MNKIIIFLMGPTASGKTNLAMVLCKKLPLEIISVDSAMIYRGMDIGTGKPTLEQLKKFPHHLIDICDPSERYSAADFCKDALLLIEKIHARQKIPLLVGGTMLYFKSLKYGLSELPSSDVEVRKKLLQEKNSLGLEEMYQRLAAIDPLAAAKIHPNDPQRILRALEIYEITGKKMTDHFGTQNGLEKTFKLIEFAIAPKKREILHEQIEHRFHDMLQNGFLDEVKKLYHRKNLDKTMPAIRSVGYRQIWSYLENEINYDTMIQKALAATRQLAKRQLTWLRAWKSLHWFYTDQEHYNPELIAAWLDNAIKG